MKQRCDLSCLAYFGADLQLVTDKTGLEKDKLLSIIIQTFHSMNTLLNFMDTDLGQTLPPRGLNEDQAKKICLDILGAIQVCLDHAITLGDYWQPSIRRERYYIVESDFSLFTLRMSRENLESYACKFSWILEKINNVSQT